MPAAVASRGSDDPIGRALTGRPSGEYVIVPKHVLRSLPPSYERTSLGYPPSLAHDGAISQYRGPRRLHVYETRSAWVAHRDAVDPRDDPLGHLLGDAPEVLAGVGVGVVASGIAAHVVRRRSLAAGRSRKQANSDAALAAIIAGLIAGGLAFVLVRSLRRR